METPEFVFGPDQHWAHLAATEQRYVDGHRSVLEAQVAPHFDFLGFLYRGVALKKSRRQTMVLSNSAIEALGIDRAAAEGFIERLVDVYLTYYGSSTTINNLILDTEHASGRMERAESIHLSFGNDTSSIQLKGTVRSIVVSTSVAASLGIDLPIWGQIRQQVLEARDNTWSAIRRSLGSQLRPVDDRVANAEREIVRAEHPFFVGLGAYILQSDAPHPKEILDALPTWLRAFQALFMFLHVFGRHWATVPVLPPFAPRLTEAGLPVPHSAVTAIANRPIEPTMLKQVAKAIGDAYPSGLRAEIDSTVHRIANYVENDQKGRIEAVQVVFPKWHPDNLRLPYDVVPYLGSLLRLALGLIGEKHEGKQLSFILLCAPEASLLRYHSGSVRRPWALRSKQVLDPRDFPDIADRPLPDLLRAISFAIQANALLLQEPGHALYFQPIAPQFVPHSIVEFVPFDARRLDALLQDFTAGDRSALAVYTRTRDARLFVDGMKVAFSDGKTWDFSTGLGGRRGSDPLLEKIQSFPWAANVSATEVARLRKVCDAVAHVAQRGYGALFFLVRGGHAPTKSTMAPVWGSASAGLLEETEPEMLSTLAGLDGETYVDVSTGVYATRQFLHVPEDQFLEFFALDRDGNLGLNQRLVKAWKDAQRQEPTTIEDIDAVYRFGTRHQKALRITWAYPNNTVAITVSSDGPIRLWARGLPLSRFSM